MTLRWPPLQIPILADVTKAVSARYGCLKRDAGIALRGLYIINPEARGGSESGRFHTCFPLQAGAHYLP